MVSERGFDSLTCGLWAHKAILRDKFNVSRENEAKQVEFSEVDKPS